MEKPLSGKKLDKVGIPKRRAFYVSNVVINCDVWRFGASIKERLGRRFIQFISSLAIGNAFSKTLLINLVKDYGS